VIRERDYQKSINIKATSINLQNNEYLNNIRDIHFFLHNNPKLNNDHKLDLCSKQRYFINLYLKQITSRFNQNKLNNELIKEK